MTLAVDIARTSLIEQGRPDLADRVRPNRKGWPSIEHCNMEQDRVVIVRAFLLAHKAAGHHRARYYQDGFLCLDCHPRAEWEVLL